VTIFALIRHMPTAWNGAARLQGRADPPLDPEAALSWLSPPELADFRWLSSPLSRAVSTAQRLGIAEPGIEPRLTEMDWGDWEGQTLAELRRSLGAEMAAEEAKGLDFRPPGGESPRDVQARIRPLLAEIALAGRDTAAVTHKGVIRAVFALASGWDMLGKLPHRLSWSAAHCFRLDPDGHPSVDRLNIPLGPR
jgi:broad specificity phosphatase PhoE